MSGSCHGLQYVQLGSGDERARGEENRHRVIQVGVERAALARSFYRHQINWLASHMTKGRDAWACLLSASGGAMAPDAVAGSRSSRQVFEPSEASASYNQLERATVTGGTHMACCLAVRRAVVMVGAAVWRSSSRHCMQSARHTPCNIRTCVHELWSISSQGTSEMKVPQHGLCCMDSHPWHIHSGFVRHECQLAQVAIATAGILRDVTCQLMVTWQLDSILRPAATSNSQTVPPDSCTPSATKGSEGSVEAKRKDAASGPAHPDDQGAAISHERSSAVRQTGPSQWWLWVAALMCTNNHPCAGQRIRCSAAAWTRVMPMRCCVHAGV